MSSASLMHCNLEDLDRLSTVYSTTCTGGVTGKTCSTGALTALSMHCVAQLVFGFSASSMRCARWISSVVFTCAAWISRISTFSSTNCTSRAGRAEDPRAPAAAGTPLCHFMVAASFARASQNNTHHTHKVSGVSETRLSRPHFGGAKLKQASTRPLHSHRSDLFLRLLGPRQAKHNNL